MHFKASFHEGAIYESVYPFNFILLYYPLFPEY